MTTPQQDESLIRPIRRCAGDLDRCLGVATYACAGCNRHLCGKHIDRAGSVRRCMECGARVSVLQTEASMDK